MTLEEKVERLETLVLRNFKIISSIGSLLDDIEDSFEVLKFISSDIEDNWHFFTEDEYNKTEELDEKSVERYKRENLYK